ncbi:signal transducer and activator of transcription 4-like [Gigantopelta aegis]|uniref:signal transducer and activator of transcription 4-like n=1 Tax=Gigantopelta aegis TaxID=1735272 RepID=UPI001B887C3F|nr:signal transducer and activator of transcription 4-like [Gigantopelta aegis]
MDKMTQIAKLEHLVKELQDQDLTKEWAVLYAKLDFVIRKRYAEYIENWYSDGDMDTDDGQGMNHGSSGDTLYNNLLQKIDNDISRISRREDNSKHIHDTLFELSLAREKLVDLFQDSMDQLPSVVQECLKKEQELLNNYKIRVQQEERCSLVFSSCVTDQQLAQLESTWLEIEKFCSQAKVKLSVFSEKHQELKDFLQRDPAPVQNGSRTFFEECLLDHNRDVKSCSDIKEGILQETNKYILDLEKLTVSVLNMVDEWRHQQKLAYVKAATEPDISQLRKCCARLGSLMDRVFFFVTHTDFYEILTKTHASINPAGFTAVPLPVNEGPVKEIGMKVKNMLEQCLKRTFVVVKQPPELIKMSGTKKSGSSREFEASVCILAARNQNIEQFSSTVQASFCLESDISKGTKTKYELKGSSVNFQTEAEAEFRELKVKEFSRDDSKSKETRVWQQRYRLVFRVKITFRTEFVFELETMSLPVILNTGSNQECSALGHLTWYCYNHNAYDLSKDFPLEIPCSTALEMLNSCIKSLGGRQLKDKEKEYLAHKMTGQRTKNYSDVKVSFNQFCEVNMASKEKTSKDKSSEFSFFKWFHAIRNLLLKYLLQPWKDGVIEGFISGSTAKMLLKDEKPGTFFLRFSESYVQGDYQGVTGGIVAVIKLQDEVSMTPPESTSRFATRSLYENLRQYIGHETREKMMKWIYPTYKPFEDVFQKYDTVPDNKSTTSQYPGWEQFLGLSLSKLQLVDHSTEVKHETDIVKMLANSETTLVTPNNPRMKQTNRVSRVKDKTAVTQRDPSTATIPNFLQDDDNTTLPRFEIMGCSVDTNGQHLTKIMKSDAALIARQSNLQRVPTKASLKRTRLSHGSTSGGIVSENPGVCSNFNTQSIPKLELPKVTISSDILKSLPESQVAGINTSCPETNRFAQNRDYGSLSFDPTNTTQSSLLSGSGQQWPVTTEIITIVGDNQHTTTFTDLLLYAESTVRH